MELKTASRAASLNHDVEFSILQARKALGIRVNKLVG